MDAPDPHVLNEAPAKTVALVPQAGISKVRLNITRSSTDMKHKRDADSRLGFTDDEAKNYNLAPGRRPKIRLFLPSIWT